MALSDEVKAARKAARQAAKARERERLAEKAAEEAQLAEEAQHAERFNKRSTRTSVVESLTDRALTIEEHRIAEARGLVGPASEPQPREPFDEAKATEWHGVPVTTRTERSALTHGHKSDDYIAPDPYPASSWDDDEDASPVLSESTDVPDETLIDLGVNHKFGDWFEDEPVDEYEALAEAFEEDDIDDRPAWDREDLG